MLTLRPAAERGHAVHGWLDSHHTFSFANYYDPAHMGFRSLRVINEDRVEAAQGFGAHPHKDMEIISYVLEGALEHRDSMGTGSVIRPGDVQRMSAGTGVTHSEFNASKTDSVHFLQIWLLPTQRGIAPSYAQRRFDDTEKQSTLRVVASPDGRDDSLVVHSDAVLRAGILAPDESVELQLTDRKHAWVQVVRGTLELNGQALDTGDGAALSDEPVLRLRGLGQQPAEVLVFELG